MGRKSKAKVRKQEILSHFYEVVIEEGFEGASIAKIARRMKVNPSLLIHYFETKEAMVLGLIDYLVDTYSATLFPDLSAVDSATERWEDLLDIVAKVRWERIMNHGVFYSCYALSLRVPEVQMRFHSLYQHILATLETEIRHADAAGVIQIRHPREAAEFLLSCMEGANFIQQLKSPPADPEAATERFKATLQRIFACGAV
jgi:AcrR family transcriptional regulator